MLFKKKEKQVLNYTQAKRYFEQLGCSILTLDLPSMEYFPKHGEHIPIAMRYDVWFEDIVTKPLIEENGLVRVVSQGKYCTQACGSTEVNGTWLPGGVTEYNIKIIDRELEIESHQERSSFKLEL